MGVLKKETTTGFTVVNNTILHDKNLSTKLRGLLITLLSLPPAWNFTITGLQAILPDGRSSIASGLRDLEKFGYLKRTQIRDAKTGLITDMDYTIYDTPHLEDENSESEEQSPNNMPENKDDIPKNKDTGNDTYNNEGTQPSKNISDGSLPETTQDNCAQKPTSKSASPKSDYPQAENQHLENPHTEKQSLQQLNTNKLNINIYNTNQSKSKESIYPSINQSLQDSNTDGWIDGLIGSPLLYNDCKKLIMRNIDYDGLISACKDKTDVVNELVEIMTGVVCSNRKNHTISGVSYPSATVKARMLMLKHKHIAYVLTSLSENTKKVRNVKAYLIATLFNAYSTIETYGLTNTDNKPCQPNKTGIKPMVFTEYEQRDYEDNEFERIIKAKQAKRSAKSEAHK